MLNRSLVLSAILIAPVSWAMAQDSAAPASDSGSASWGGSESSLIVPQMSGGLAKPPGLTGPGPAGPGDTQAAGPETTGTAAGRTGTGTASAEPEGPSFLLPGGYGNTSQLVTPGVGMFAKPPIAFSATIKQGYDDNIYSASGKRGKPTVIPEQVQIVTAGPFSYPLVIPRQVIQAPDPVPVKGSLISMVTVNTDILLSASRAFLSLDLNLGGSYYWDREGNPLDPAGGIAMLLAYKVTPRMQLSTQLNGGYYTQPNLALPNAPTQPGSGNYINITDKSDLTYQWRARFSTDTSFEVNTQLFQETASQSENYFEETVGQTFNYLVSPRITAVLDMRTSQIRYNDETRNSDTQSLLGGFELMLGPRFTGSFRAGESFRHFDLPDVPTSTSPFVESTLAFGYGKASSVQWTNRYGFEESSTAFQRTQAYRTGLSLTQVFSPKLSGSISVNFAHSLNTSITDESISSVQDTFGGSLGLQFVATRTLTFFGNITRSQVMTDDETNSYARNQIFFGATYHF